MESPIKLTPRQTSLLLICANHPNQRMWVIPSATAERKQAQALHAKGLIEPDGDLDGSYRITTKGASIPECMIQLPTLPKSRFCKHCAQILSREKFYPGCPSCCKKCCKKRRDRKKTLPVTPKIHHDNPTNSVSFSGMAFRLDVDPPFRDVPAFSLCNAGTRARTGSESPQIQNPRFARTHPQKLLRENHDSSSTNHQTLTQGSLPKVVEIRDPKVSDLRDWKVEAHDITCAARKLLPQQ